MTRLGQKYILILAVAGWVALIGAAVIRYFGTAANSCSIFSRLNVSESILASTVFSLGLILVSAAAVGAYFNLNFVNGQNNKGVILTFLLLFLALITVPFNTNDISFYYSAGIAANASPQIYTQTWFNNNFYFCPALKGAVPGVMYGPEAISALKFLTALSGDNPVTFVIIWKLLMVVSFLVCMGLGVLILKKVGVAVHGPAYYLLWLSQPLLLWEGVANGHFDILMEVFILASVLFAIDRRWWLVIISLLIGAWLKFVPLILGPVFLLWWWQSMTKEEWKGVAIQTVIGSVVGIFITWAAWVPYWSGSATLTPVILQTKWVANSLFGVIYYSLAAMVAAPHKILTLLAHASVGLLALYFVWPLVKQAVAILLKRANFSPIEFLKIILVGMLVYLGVWQKSFWPWYITWLLPIGFILLASSTNLYFRKILIWISVAPVGFYLVWFLNRFIQGTEAPNELWFWYVVVAGVWFYPFVQLYKWRKDGFNLS